MFNRECFNRLYFMWFSVVARRDLDIAKQCDIEVISYFGKWQAKKIKQELGNIEKGLKGMTYLYNALSRSHWFQESVKLVKITSTELILQCESCSFQEGWIKRFGNSLDCIESHKGFLKAFCNEIDRDLQVQNLIKPADKSDTGIYCKWKIIKVGSESGEQNKRRDRGGYGGSE